MKILSNLEDFPTRKIPILLGTFSPKRQKKACTGTRHIIFFGLTLSHELAYSLDKGIQTDMVVLDFSKAFDLVPHQRLLKKLGHYGIRGSTHRWISSFLSSRTQQVIVEGATSDQVPVVSGVPHGTVLGPLLFLIFINDLPDGLKSSTRLFADDCIVYRQIRAKKDCDILQNDLQTLSEWEQTWGIEFHPQKCTVLRVTRKRRPIEHTYLLKGATLTVDKSTKYLGVDIHSTLSWNTNIDRTTKKANNMLGFLRRNLRHSFQATKVNAYKTLVLPHLEY